MGSRYGCVPQRACAVGAIVFCLLFCVARAVADDDDERVTGRVSAADGAPIAGAGIALTNDRQTYRTHSDRKGKFKFKKLPDGTYVLSVSARGYSPIAGQTIAVSPGRKTSLALVLEPATTNSLTTIGEVHATCCGETLSTTAGPSVTRSAQQAAAQGITSVGQMLWSLPALTPAIPLGGGSNARISYAVRGPDPTETLVDIDGHQVNNGATGDFDLSLLDPASLQDVQVIYGISPASLIGPNTLGGAINVVTLEPTQNPHVLLRGFGGSFDSFGETVQSTGSIDRFGYAVALHKTTSDGQINETIEPVDTGATAAVGSTSSSASLLAKLRYTLSGDGFVELSLRNQTEYKDLSALLSSYPAPGGGTNELNSFAGTSLAAHNAGYTLDVQLPGGWQFSHMTSLSSQSVNGPGANSSPYLYNDRDLIGDDWIQWDRAIGRGTLSVKADLATESLLTGFSSAGATDDAVFRPALAAFADVAPAPATYNLAQTQRSGVVRYSGDPSTQWHYTLAAYLSDFSSFGWSFDPRASVTWTPTASTAVRASVGTTFQAPQLTSLVVPSPLPKPVNGLISIGNPNLQPDRATEYDLGWEQLFGATNHQSHLTFDLYRTNLRTPTTIFIPAHYNPNCRKNCQLSYPINVGGQVYQGAVVSLRQQVGRGFVADASWDVGSSYLTQTYPGSTILTGEQTLGDPLHKASFGIARDVAEGLVYGARVSYEGRYNELNRSPYATLDASVAYRTHNLEFGVYGTNLTNAYDDLFTAAGAGVPYAAADGTATPTNAYALQGAKVVFVVTQRW
jgi:outer membrane receptor protein involved in Fe transport